MATIRVKESRSTKLKQILQGGIKFTILKDPMERVYEVDKAGGLTQDIYRVKLVGVDEDRIYEGTISGESHHDTLVVANTIIGQTVILELDVNKIVILSNPID